MKKYTVIAVKWFDRIYGNTYHSVRCIRHSDEAQLSSGKTLVYGYSDHYRQTALELMHKHGWLVSPEQTPIFRYERDNGYPIIWTVSNGLKREAVANGQL